VPDAPDLAATVSWTLLAHPAVHSVTLVGSRAHGDPSPLSDWDFVIAADDAAAVISALPTLVTPLDPLAQQWDRLGPTTYRCYMLMLRGPVKIDLILPDVPHQPAPRWVATPENLEAIDHHFWDWILWMTAKEQGQEHELVHQQLGRISDHLLRPMGVEDVPATIARATDDYITARDRLADRSGVHVSHRVQDEVKPILPRS
jgi:hypothetical protein